MSQKKKKRERIKAPLGADAEKLMFQFRLPPSLVQSKRQALLGEELQKRAKEKDFPITELLKKHPLGVGLGHSRRLKLHDANLDEKHLTEAAEAILATTTLPSPSFAAPSLEYNTSSPDSEVALKVTHEALEEASPLKESPFSIGSEKKSRKKNSIKKIKENGIITTEQSSIVNVEKAGSFSMGNITLNNWFHTKQFMDIFVNYIWLYSPLHPSSANEDNVRAVLMLGEPFYEKDFNILALNVHISLALGAQVYGDTGRAVYHYRIAREHLGYLFDISDYAVAEALTAMRYFAFVQGDTERASYYMTLAMGICKRLEGYNSDVYLRCMWHLYFLPSTTPDEKKEILLEYKRNINLPSYEKQIIYDMEVSSNSNYHLHVPLLVRKSSYKTYNKASLFSRFFTSFLVAYHLLDDPSPNISPSERQHCLKVLLDKLRTVEHKLQQAAESLPVAFVSSIIVCVWAIRSELLRWMGQDSQALLWAQHFVGKFQSSPEIHTMCGMVLPWVTSVSEFVLYANDLQSLSALMDAIEPLACIFPSWRRVKTTFLEHLRRVHSCSDGDHGIQVHQDFLNITACK